MRQKSKNRLIRFASVMLTLSMLLQTTAMAEGGNQNAANPEKESVIEQTTQETETVGQKDIAEMAIVSEDESLRGEYEKHFLCEDGSYVAVSYNTPVNFLDEDGEWQEIDNTLEEDVDENGNATLKNKNGLMDVEFAQNAADENKLVKVESDGYEVSWSVEAVTDSDLLAEKIIENALSEEYLTEITDMTVNEAVTENEAATATETHVFNENFDFFYDNDSMYTGNDLIQGTNYWKYDAQHWS